MPPGWMPSPIDCNLNLTRLRFASLQVGASYKVRVERMRVVCRVVQGAVVYGLNPNMISSRISRRTYGVSADGPFQAGVHDPSRLVIGVSPLSCLR
eukprot:1177637-Prorocentrum_minimum.AAC.1